MSFSLSGRQNVLLDAPSSKPGCECTAGERVCMRPLESASADPPKPFPIRICRSAFDPFDVTVDMIVLTRCSNVGKSRLIGITSLPRGRHSLYERHGEMNDVRGEPLCCRPSSAQPEKKP